MYNLIFKNVIEHTYESAKRWMVRYEFEQVSTDCSIIDALGIIIYSCMHYYCRHFPILIIY